MYLYELDFEDGVFGIYLAFIEFILESSSFILLFKYEDCGLILDIYGFSYCFIFLSRGEHVST